MTYPRMEATKLGRSASASKSSRYRISVANTAPPSGAPKMAPIPDPIPAIIAMRASAGLRSSSLASSDAKPALIWPVGPSRPPEPPDPMVSAEATIFTMTVRKRIPLELWWTAEMAASVPWPSASGANRKTRIAPEAEGHGTDAAISAVHHNPRGIRFRAVIVKIVASALTIGSGGSGGREGPTGQISAGFASLLARELDLSPADARIAMMAGIGSGIGAIFGAPLGGAVLATEILYRDDFDAEALLPSFVASILGYVIFGAAVGYTPLFGFNASYQF